MRSQWFYPTNRGMLSCQKNWSSHSPWSVLTHHDRLFLIGPKQYLRTKWSRLSQHKQSMQLSFFNLLDFLCMAKKLYLNDYHNEHYASILLRKIARMCGKGKKHLQFRNARIMVICMT